MKYRSKCPKCGNVDTLTEQEIEKTVHCQCCYQHYKYGKYDATITLIEELKDMQKFFENA